MISSSQKIIGGGSEDGGESIKSMKDGGYILASYTSSQGLGQNDILLTKMDSDGNEEFSETYGGFSSDGPSEIVITADGGFIIFGSTSSFGEGQSDYYLIKTDAKGRVF